MANYVILDAGHAKVTAGKRSPDGKLLEWEFNNDMQYRLKKRLEQMGFVVCLVNPTPEQGSEVSLATRCTRANNYWTKIGKSNCIFVSLHANAAGTGGWSNARGVETYTASNASSNSVKLAKLINDNIYKDVVKVDSGFKNRGCKTNSFYVVKHTNMPCCLVEYEFYTNQAGVSLLTNKRELLCEATLKGICGYFGVAYKPTSTAAQQPVVNTPNVPSTTKPFKNGTYNVKAKVTATTLNVRAGRPGSSTYNTILGKLSKGTVVTIGYCLNGWFGIVYNGKQAFISGDYIELV